mmetsp:Transcript_69372/g.219526  ORF Transcript_69372/g.219526 Transcript_69372/m.219526 type:complete len:593 (+) Transcript_69372:46-1824(+)
MSAPDKPDCVPTHLVGDEVVLLSERHKTWCETTPAERDEVAKEILACLSQDAWGTADGWTGDSALLEGFDLAAGGADMIPGMARFILGNTVKVFLTTFLNRNGQAPPKSTRPDGLEVYGPIAMGVAAPGHTAELWCNPAKAEERAREAAGAPKGTATLVLGAGNQNFLTAIDLLDRILLRGDTVLLKHHPIRGFLSAPYALIFAPLIRRGLLAQTLEAGIPATQEIITHPKIGHVAITGSEGAYLAIRAALDAAGKKSVAVTAELGNVTPVLVVPGEWTPEEIRAGAKNVAQVKKANAGSNCLSPQALVLPKDWPQRAEFVKALDEELANMITNPAYYPGSAEKRQRLLSSYTEGETSHVVKGPSMQKGSAAQHLDVAVVDCGTVGDSSFRPAALLSEAFGAVLAVVDVPGGSGAGAEVTEYIRSAAVPFLNSDNVTGTLTAVVLAPGSAPVEAVDAAVAGLQYGSIHLNSYSIQCYLGMTRGCIWGAHTKDERSGRGFVGNAYGLPGPEKTVVRGPPLAKPSVDLGKPIPPLLIDVLHTVTVAGSPLGAIYKIVSMLLLRSVQGVTNPLLGLAGLRMKPFGSPAAGRRIRF